MQFQEGNLLFTFNNESPATKYDDWAFYRNQFQKVTNGTKAVDFICIDNTSNATWLIEVKDYRHPSTDAVSISELGSQVAIKIKDTLAGLAAAKNQANDIDEKSFANMALKTHRFNVVLHVEVPTHRKIFLNLADLKTKLKQQLKAIDAHPKVTNQSQTVNGQCWIVTE